MFLLSIALADPCGMVFPPPPPHVLAEGGTLLRRDGAQRTWVAFAETEHGGMETMVLRPGFVGEVEEFGMLIPFPSPPTIRKVDENIFSHIEATVDPPPMAVDVTYPVTSGNRGGLIGMKGTSLGTGGLSSRGSGLGGGAAVEPTLGYYEVEVLREEAVGMYEVAVLQAGSPEALERWMTANDFAWPEGMEEPVWAYVEARWCFVAIKARVGAGDSAVPFPGMRAADTNRPEGSSFDGFVQAMGFRFETDEPVLPMRLSVHNPAVEPPRNVVYMLTDEAVAITDLSHDLVTRQVPGDEVFAHLHDPLPLWFRTGDPSHVHPAVFEQFADLRAPAKYNGIARDLIASDLVAFQNHEMELDFERASTELLNISEALGLRGEAIDDRMAAVVDDQKDEQLLNALDTLSGMTLTVLDGQFDVEVLARQNLRFEPFSMDEGDNTFRVEAVKPTGPAVSVPAAWVPRASGTTVTFLLPGASVTGGLPTATVDRVIARNRNRLQYCYLREQTKAPNLQGKLELKLVVAPDGSVTSATVTGNTLNASVGSCIERVALRFTFPDTSAGISVVRVPMAFRP